MYAAANSSFSSLSLSLLAVRDVSLIVSNPSPDSNVCHVVNGSKERHKFQSRCLLVVTGRHRDSNHLIFCTCIFLS